MAESTLSITFSDIRRQVAHFAGWNLDPTNWSSQQTSDFTDIVRRGLRKFYFPPSLEPGQPRHGWSFLRVNATQAITASDYDYTLPDDFSGVIVDESVTYSVGSGLRRLEKIPEAQLRTLQSKNSQSGTPVFYCVRARTHAPTTGHRFELLLYPTPSASATLSFRYETLPNTITSSDIYPHGGAMHSGTIIEAILSEAESMLDDNPEGVHYKRFLELLSSSIRTDKEHAGTQPGVAV